MQPPVLLTHFSRAHVSTRPPRLLCERVLTCNHHVQPPRASRYTVFIIHPLFLSLAQWSYVALLREHGTASRRAVLQGRPRSGVRVGAGHRLVSVKPTYTYDATHGASVQMSKRNESDLAATRELLNGSSQATALRRGQRPCKSADIHATLLNGSPSPSEAFQKC